MSSQKDYITPVAVSRIADLSLDMAAGDKVGAAVNQTGFQSIAFAIKLTGSAAIGVGDVMNFAAQESDDNATYTAVASDAIISPTGNTLIAPVSPYLQTFGVISAKKYVKPVIHVTALSPAQTAEIVVLQNALVQPDTHATTAKQPGDGKP